MTTRQLSRRTLATGAAVVALTLLGTSAVRAWQALDRTKIPPAGKPAMLNVPVWTSGALANGAELRVVERHGLPLVSFTITFMGGADQFETADKRGVAGFTTAMMNEGTATRDADTLANQLQLLGSGIGIGISSEGGTVQFQSTAAKFQPMLDILADVLEHPVFPAASLERLRGQRLVGLAQQKNDPGSMAGRVFPRILYGAPHPYAWPTTEDTTKAITRDDVVAFHKAYFQPGRALVTVTGDVTAATVKATLDKALAGWGTGGSKPAFQYPALPATHPTTIYLVDRPGAAQSRFAIGNPGPARTTPDYYAITVMNHILGSGANFGSRINMNIREEKGYSYGVSSRFAFGKGPGAFQAGGDVVSDKSDLALVEFMKELRGIQGARPITDEELKSAKDSLIQALPGQFASIGGINSSITSIWTQGLPATYYQDYAARIAAVTREDLVRVAKQYIDLDHLTIVIVGDRSKIEAGLKATNIAPVVVVDVDAKPVVAGTR
jgi:zinc protease